ncbi:MAG: hypothetical protein GEU82_12455 [Luteitalea sp.]|nr:hypothetical protein [Luteitalea sp.]
MRQLPLFILCTVVTMAACSSPSESRAPEAPNAVALFEGARLITGDGSAPIDDSAFLMIDRAKLKSGWTGEGRSVTMSRRASGILVREGSPPMFRYRAASLAFPVFALAAVPSPGASAPDASRLVQRRSPQTSTPAVRPDESLIVNVPATSPWTDTGVVVARGDRLGIRASGQVTPYGSPSARPNGPNGSGVGGSGCEWVVTRAADAYSLVGNVAPDITFDGGGFQVGSRWAGAVPVSGASALEGHLLLGFNGNAMLCDRSGYDSWAFRIANSGAFTVAIEITRSRAVPPGADGQGIR